MVLGMFWMSFKDLVKHFNHVDVCMVRHKLYHPVPWVEKRSRYCTCIWITFMCARLLVCIVCACHY